MAMLAALRGPRPQAQQWLADMVLLRLFGHPVLERGGSRTQIGTRPKAVALLAILAANHARPLSREWLAQSLWPDADSAEARANLRRHLHLLSKAIGEEAFLLTRHTAQWNVQSPVGVDVIRFDSLAHTEAALAVQEYAGELCTGIEDDVLDALRVRYRSNYEALLRKLIDAARDAADDTSLAVWLQHAINHDPFDESSVREVMRLRRRHGDRAGALREYNAFAQRLRSELGAEPEAETLSLFSEIVAEDPVPATAHNLQPPATTFVGRDRELAETTQALRESRIVTLLGPGGIGKTRLATRVCFDVLLTWREGIWFIELEHAKSGAAIWDRIAESIGLAGSGDPQKRALQHLQAKRALIVFDTCEHILEAAREIAEQITSQTGATVLCTSRRPLRATGESIIEVGPLEIPPAGLHAGESPLRYPAYRLFLERAAMINPTFRVAPRQARALAEVLQRIDGLPLAIELVASRANVLTIEGMRARLATAMRTVQRNALSARAQTIDDAIAWSYDLLSREQRTLFAWLSVFSGRFSIEDVEQVCAAVPNAVESLLELVDASLVSIVAGEHEVQYRLLETTRAFAAARLAEGSDAHPAFLAHAQHAACKADELTALSTVQYDLRVSAITADISDYLIALERCVSFGWVALGARILEGLHRYGLRRHFCDDLLRLTLALLETDRADSPTAARLHRFVGAFAPWRGLLPLARAHTEKACTFYRTSGEESRLCEALTALAVISYDSACYSETEQLLLEVRERAERLGDEAMLFKTLGRLGALYLALPDGFDRALTYLEQAAAGLRTLNEVHQLGYALKNLATAAWYAGYQARAVEYAEQGLALPSAAADPGLRALLLSLQASAYREMGEIRQALSKQLEACSVLGALSETASFAETLEDAATTLERVGELEIAARLLGFAEALRRRIGAQMNPGLSMYYDRTQRRLEDEFGSAFASIRSSGEAETGESIIALARETIEKALAKDSEDTTSLS